MIPTDEMVEAGKQALRRVMRGLYSGEEHEILAREVITAALASVPEPGADVERLRAALEPFAAIYEIFAARAPLRPQSGNIMAWEDHRIGERVLTVEHLKAASDAISPPQRVTCKVCGGDCGQCGGPIT